MDADFAESRVQTVGASVTAGKRNH